MIKNCKNCKCEFETPRNDKVHCSKKCFFEYRTSPEVLKETLKKRAEFNLKKYGVDNPSKSDIIKEKSKQTCLKRYGVSSPTLVDYIHKKQIETNIKRYGVENPQQNIEIQKKQQATLLKNYGVLVPLKNKNIIETSKQTCIEKYGVDNPSKSKLIQLKIINTNLKKYGVKYPVLCNNIKEKMNVNALKNHYNNVILKSDKYNNVTPLFSENEYKGNMTYNTTYLFNCKICSINFEDTLMSGNIPKCPICYPPKIFYEETELKNYIKSILSNENIILENDRKILSGLELDIYIPSKNIAIEFNGLYWHSEVNGKKYKNYHLNKTTSCENKGIQLIHIFEDEWINNKDIIKHRLKHVLGVNNSDKIYARKCEIKEISSKECNIFLQTHHSQGVDKSSIKIGAYFNNELVSVMTFGNLRIALGNRNKIDGVYEMYRFCIGFKNVIGISGKLLTYFIKNYNPNKIISYVDKRWSTKSHCYLNNIGFKYIKDTSPNYWYIKCGYKQRFYRFNFRKDQLNKKLEKFDSNLTEWENMQLNGYDRIWDCGNLKYEWIKPKIEYIYT